MVHQYATKVANNIINDAFNTFCHGNIGVRYVCFVKMNKWFIVGISIRLHTVTHVRGVKCWGGGGGQWRNYDRPEGPFDF